MATRKAFSAASMPDHDAAPAGPAKPNFSCRAQGCMMPGAIQGHCSHHWMAHTHDWPRITAVLYELQPVVKEILFARQTMSSADSDPVLCIKGHIAAAKRLEGHLTEDQLAYLASKASRNYSGWAYDLEFVVTMAIQKVIKKRRDERNTEHPMFAHRVRAAQIPGQAADYFGEEFGEEYGA